MMIFHSLSTHAENISNMLQLNDGEYSQIIAETEHHLKLLINLMLYALSSELWFLVSY